MITVKTFVFNPFYENTFVLSDETGEAIIVDAGNYTEKENQEIDAYLSDNNLTPVKLVNTHCHIDHISGIEYLKNKYQLQFYANSGDQSLLDGAKKHGLVFGFEIEKAPSIDVEIKGGDTVTFGSSELSVYDVPGHSRGHVALHAKADNFILVGDVLFNNSIGRTDLEGGDYDVLMNSIRTQLLPLEDTTKVLSGHGPHTTIGDERQNNPFLQDVKL